MKKIVPPIHNEDTRRSFTCNSLLAFTLVEMSIVLIIIALVIGMTLGSGVYVIGSARLVATQKKMAAIDQALMAYRIAHDQLPCPSDLTQVKGGSTSHTTAYGAAGTCVAASITGSSPWGVRTSVSTGVSGQVLVAEGGVPTYDLGLPYEFMYDGWGNRIRYAVDVTMANTGSNTNTFSGTQIGAVCGAITIQGDPMPATGTYAVGADNYTRSSGAIYALISHGPNGHGAFTASGTIQNSGSLNADEQTNCGCGSTGAQTTYTPTYVQEQPYVYNTANPLYNFDDIVTYKERWQMQVPNDTWGSSCPMVYVADSSNSRIQAFDMSGNYISQFGSSGHGNIQFTTPYGIFIDNSSNAWVADSGYARIQKIALSPAGTATYVATIGTGGTTGTASGLFNYPYSVAVDSNGNIWVADDANERVQKFTSGLSFVLGIGNGYQSIGSSIGSVGYLNGEFYSPYGIAIDPSNNVWVLDKGNNRVQEFSNSGTWIQSIGWDSSTGQTYSGLLCETSPNSSGPACSAGNGGSNVQLNAPQGITADRFGNVWVADTGNTRIAEFSSNGSYIGGFATAASSAPTGIAVDPSGNVWVVNYTTQNLQKWTCYTTPCTSSSSWTSTTYGSSGSGNGKFSNPFSVFIPQTR